MTNNTQNINNFQPKSRRELIELSKLSKLPPRTPFRLPEFDNGPTTAATVVTSCAGCYTRLDTADPIQMRFSSCRKCVGIHGRVDAAAEANEKRDRRETLAKFASEVK
ncbi:MAG: hypothetical protein ACR2L1_07760 [Pyrinomonadaceae bacterium]